MDLTQIRYFLALTRTLNFTRAAEACNVTQPALTRSIQRLEDEMGGPLILRERGLTQLTELGRRVQPMLQQAADAAQAAARMAREFSRQDRMPLRLGVGIDVETVSLAPVRREIGRRMPKLAVSVRLGDTAEINQWLLGAEVDAGLTADVEGLTERANRWPLFDDEVVVLMAAADELAGDGPIDSTVVAGQLVLARTPGDAPLDRLRTRLAALAKADARHVGTTHEHLQHMVLAGLGLGLSTARQKRRDGLHQRPLAPAERLHIVLAAIPGRPMPQAAQIFLKLARARSWAEPDLGLPA